METLKQNTFKCEVIVNKEKPKEQHRQCGYLALNKAELSQHYTDVHVTEFWECNKCGEEFNRALNFKIHMDTLHGVTKVKLSHPCNLCPIKFKNLKNLIQHKVDTHGYVRKEEDHSYVDHPQGNKRKSEQKGSTQKGSAQKGSAQAKKDKDNKRVKL